MSKRKISAVLLSVSLLVFAAGCKKKVPAPPAPPPPIVNTPPPAPPAAKPTLMLSAEPSSIDRGQASTLKWTVTNATDISINQGIGAVSAKDSRTVYPSNTTTYTLTATGPGGSGTTSATVTVNAPPPPPPPTPPTAPKRSLSERLGSDVQDVYYDYDKSDVRDDGRAVLTRNAEALKAILGDFPTAVISVEGHCDERGSAEYNLGLGDRRATSAKDFLVQLGVPADRLKAISYGKERPQCTDSNEECWQKNRRAHFGTGQ